MRLGFYLQDADIPDWIQKKTPRVRLADWHGGKPIIRYCKFTQPVVVIRYLFGGTVHVYRTRKWQLNAAHFDADYFLFEGSPTLWH